jgi:CBS domain-containing protein
MTHTADTCGTVRDWMTHDPVRVAPDYPVGRALALMDTLGVRHLLVADGERITGIVSNRDVRRLLGRADLPPDLTLPVSRIMTAEPTTVAHDTPITAAGRMLLEGRFGALPVHSGEQIIGIFTTADALDALLTLAEAGVVSTRPGTRGIR